MGMIESEIGGRPIATIRLQSPICHGDFTVSCIEVPCPKGGRDYKRGLEHAEFVVGTPDDGFRSNVRLLDLVAKHPQASFDTRALNKECNADVSLSFDSPKLGRCISAKF